MKFGASQVILKAEGKFQKTKLIKTFIQLGTLSVQNKASNKDLD